MTKFDFKKWVIEHKHGKKSLDEQMMRGRGRDATSPLIMCEDSVTDPITGVADLSRCHRFSECINGQSDGSGLVRLWGSALANPENFYNALCPGCVPGDVIEMSDGRKWIYDGTGIDAQMNFQNFGTLIGPSTCIMSVMGCMDPLANNFNATSTVDDGTCAYGYDCNQRGRHPKFGSKCTPNMDPGTNGTFQTLQACVSSGCEGFPGDTGKVNEPTNKIPNDVPVDIEPTEY